MCRHTLYLIRHGQYEVSDKHPYGTLTAIGRQQVEYVAAALKGIPFAAFYTSPLSRAVETAYIIAPHFMDVQVQIVEGLREIVPCIPLEHADLFAIQMPDLTPQDIIIARRVADATFDRLFHEPQEEDFYSLIIAHGNIIEYFVSRVLEMPCEKWMSFETLHTGITRCSVGARGQMKLLSYNDTGHLPPELRLMS